MKRPHPYLALAGACAAVAILTISALACPAEAQRVPPSDMDVLPVISGHVVYHGSQECSPRTDRQYVPSVQRADAIRNFTRHTIELDLDTKALTTPLSYETWRELIKIDFGQKFVDRPVFGSFMCPGGWNGGPPEPYPCSICAAGIGYLVPSVSTSEPDRVEALIAHETTNARLGILQRSDLWDGAYVSSVVKRVGERMGGYQTSDTEARILSIDATETGAALAPANE